MAGPKQRERPDETHGAVPQIQPQAQPNVFQQPQSQGVSNPMFKFGIADGVVDIMRGAAITMDVNGPITLEKARQHEDRLDGWMRERQGGEWAYETRVTSGNMHVASAKLEQAERARSEGRTDDANRLQKEGEEHYRMALYQQRELGRAEAVGGDLPKEFRDAQRGVWATAGRGGEAWSNALYSTTSDYVRNKAAFESGDPRMREANQELLETVSVIGTRAMNGEPFDPNVTRRIDAVMTTATAYMADMQQSGALASRLAASEGIKNQELRKAMKGLSEDMEKLLKKISDGTATKDDLEKAREAHELIKDTEQIIITVDSEGRPVVERILARGAVALMSGKSADAKAQRTLAKEYAYGDKEYRKKLEEWSDALASGKMSAAEVLKQMKVYKEQARLDFEKKPITEASALSFVSRLESFLRTRGFDKNKEFDKEVKDIRQLNAKGVELAKKAEAARKAGMEKEAKEYEKLSRFYLKVADARLGTLEYIQRLKDSKAPQFLIDAAKSAYWLLGTENDWRAKLVIKAVGLFLNNKGLFGSKAGEGVLKSLGGFLGWLSNPKNAAKQDEEEKKYAAVEREAKRSGAVVSLDIEATVSALEKAGAPKELVAAVKAAKSMIGTAQHDKAMFILAAAAYYLDNKDRFKGKEGQGLLARFAAFVKMVSDAEKLTPDQEKEAKEYLAKLDKELDKVQQKKPVEEKVPEEAPAPAPTPRPVAAPQPKQEGAAPVKFANLVRLRREKGAKPAVAKGVEVADKEAQGAATALEQAGAPAELVKAVRESRITDPRARAMMLDAAKFYADNITTLNMPQMAQTKQFFEQLIGGLASSQLQKEQYDKVDALLGQAKQFVGGFWEMFRTYMGQANGKAADDMEMQRAYATDPLFRKMLAANITEARGFDKLIADGEISAEKYDNYSKKLAIAEQAGSLFLNIDDADTRAAIEPYLGRAMLAASEGKFEEAKFQLMLAKEAIGADGKYRKYLSGLSSDLESGKTDFGSAKEALAGRFAADLDKGVSSLSDENPAKASFGAYALSLRSKGKDISIEDLQRASDAKAVVFDITQSEKLLSQKAHRDAKEGAYRIFDRTAASFIAGDPIESVELQLYLGRRFILNKDERESVEKASAGFDSVSQRIRSGALDPQSDEGQKAVGAYFAFRTLSEKSDIMAEERKKAKRGSAEWKLYDKLVGELDRYRTKLANGEQVTEDEAKKAEGLFVMFFGSRNDMLGTFGLEADGILGNMGHVPSGDRQKAAQMGLYAFEAWEKGDLKAWGVYARAGAALATPDKKLRKEVIALAEGYHEGKVPPSKAEWYSAAYLAKANVERGIKDNKLLRNVDGYFSQVTAAYERGDLNGAQTGLDVIALYGENSALGKAADKDTSAYVDRFFGKGGAFELAKKNNTTLAQSYAEANGMQYSQDGSAAIITGIEYETRSRRMHASERAFVKENDEAFLEKGKRRERQYGQERARLEGKARSARKKKDEIEAARLDEEATYVDYAWVLKMSANSKELYSQGVKLFDEAIELRRRAAAEPDKAPDLEAKAADLERQSQKYIAVSGTMLGGLRTFDRSVTTIYTNHRERGRENLWKGISGISEVSMGTLGTPGFNDEQDKRLQAFNGMAGVGNQEVSRQEGIQDEKRRFMAWFKRMEEQAAKLEEQYKGVRWGMYISEEEKGGFNHYEYWKWDDPNRPAGIGWNEYKDKWKVVFDKTDMLAEIERGKNYAHGENFGRARNVAKRAEAKLSWSAVAGRSVKEYENLKPNMRPVGDHYYDIVSYQKDLEVAWQDIMSGNYGRAGKLIGNVSDRVTIDGAHQEMDNLAWDLENRAAYVHDDKNKWDSFDPMLMVRGSFDSKAAEKYKAYIEYLKNHKATFVRRDQYGNEEKYEYNPFEVLKKSYEIEEQNLLAMAKGIKEQIPLVKTVEDVTFGKRALGEIYADKGSIEAFTDPMNALSNVNAWIDQGIMNKGGGAYLMAFSGHASARKTLADYEQGWMVTKDAYTNAVESFMPAHYLLRTSKLEKYGGNLAGTSNRWLQLADNFAADPKLVEQKIISGRNVRLPELENREIGDVKITGDSYLTDVPSLIGAMSSWPMDSYMKMSGENFLGYSGIGLWDDVHKIARESGQKIILGSWGYGFDPNGGRVLVPGRMDVDNITLPVYAGKWVKMDFSDDEREIILKARQGMKQASGEFFGDAIKLNDYIISDKSPGYFTAKARAMDDWGKAVDKVVGYQLNKPYYDAQREKRVREAERKRDFYFKKYEETHDYKYYELQGEWSLKKFELEKNEFVTEANRWIRKGDDRNAETKPMMADAASKEHWAGPIKVVAYGVTIVATGGTGAFVIGFKETVSSINNFQFQIDMAGGYDNLSTKEKVLGWGGIGLSALGAVSPAFSELGLAAHAPRMASVMNWTLVGGGIAMSVYQLPELYQAWKKGEMSGLAFGANFFANMQPALQIGIFGLAPKPITNKYLRVTSAILFGMPLSEHKPPLLERENYAVAYSKMAEYNKGRFAELETRVGGLSADEAIGVMKFFKETPMPLDWAEQMVKDYRKSHALPENVLPDQKGSLSRFEKIPLDKFAEKYEETVAFPEVSGWQFPKPAVPEKKPEPKPEKKPEEQPAVTGEFVIRPVKPEPQQEQAKVIVDMPLSGVFLNKGQFELMHPAETGGAVQVRMPDGTMVERQVYHNVQHSENVSKMAYDLAMKRPFTEADAKVFGSKEEKATFLGQVGLLHDVDATRDAGKPARVSATLEWMDSAEGQKVMREQFKWDDAKIAMAKAIIQRTEFPFDNARVGEKTALGFPRGAIPTYDKDANMVDAGSNDRISNRYKENSPQALYEDYLSKMTDDQRAFVLREAPVLSEYADKSSWYIEGKKSAYDSVTGLGTETGFDMFAGTAGFLKGIGQAGKDGSFKTDVEIAKKFGLDIAYPGMEEVLKLMGPDAEKNWKSNSEMFARIAKAGDDARTQAAELKKPDGSALFDEAGLKAISQRAVALEAGAESVAFNGDFPRTWNDNMAKYGAADPVKFAVAERLLDAALTKQGLDPDKVRADPLYGDYLLSIMGADSAEKAFVAGKAAQELPYKMEERSLEYKLSARGISGPVADDARLILKAARGQDLAPAETKRMIGLPKEVQDLVSPNMTYENAIMLARKVHGMKPQEPAMGAETFSNKGLEARIAEKEWMTTGKETGAVIKTVEGWVKAEAIAGNESDIIVVAGDKRKLNQINQLFGKEIGDYALDAYRDIFKSAVTDAAGKDKAFLIRPSESGDEAVAIIIVPKGKGAEVRANLEKSLAKASEDVFNKTVGNPDHPLYEAGKLVRNSKDMVAALVDISQPVEVRVVDGKPVAHYADGTEIKPEARKGFLSVVVTSTDEQGSAAHAPGMRKSLGVGTKAEIEYGTDMIGKEERVSGVAFEVKLSVDDPKVLAEMKGLLPTTGKGLYEVEKNGFGIRGLNTFLGHYGANAVINTVEASVGAYALAHGLNITRVGTLKYVIEGGNAQQAKELGAYIDGKLHEAGMKMSTSLGTIAQVKNADGAEVTSSISNGHLGVEWAARDYDVANAAISAMAIANDKTLTGVLGAGHGMDPVIKMVRNHPEIRNVQDLYVAFDDPALAGKDGPAMKKAFGEYVKNNGDAFMDRLGELSKKPEGGGAPPQAAPAVVPGRVIGGREGQVVGEITPKPPKPKEVAKEPKVIVKEPAEAPQPYTAQEARDSVSALGLGTSEGLANFVRKVALGDKDAVATLARMPENVRNEIEVFTNDNAVITIAKNDALFKSYFEDVHGLGRQIMSEAAGKIGDLVKPEAQGQKMKAAVGAESVYDQYVAPPKPAQEGRVIGGREGQVVGEITPKPPKPKEVAKEPKVIVESQPEPAPGGLEDLTAAAPPRFTNAKIMEALSKENHPDAKDAMTAYSELDIAAQAGVFRELHARANKEFMDAAAYEASGQPDAAAFVRAKGELMRRNAMALGELMALKGDVGKGLEKAYSLKDGELAKAYIEAGSIEKGREEVAKRLGIKIDARDDDVFGMLTTGNLTGMIRGLYPDAKAIEMENIGGGATGAYMVKVTDSAGAVHREFVKKVDMTADSIGAQNLRLSGIPSPDVITTNAQGQPLMYLRPDGAVSKYGISRNIGDFSGTLRIAGKDISVTTDKSVSLGDMLKSPEIMDIFMNHPDVFWNELGYMNAAGFAVGAIDGHQGNVFGMILDIKNPTTENIKALKDSGAYVFTDERGNYKMFRLGRIDTDDSAGTYWAVGEKGNFSFDSFDQWMGERHVYPRLMLHLTQARNMYEANRAGPYVIRLPPDKVAYAQGMAWPVVQAADGSFVLQTYSPTQAKKFADAGFADVISRPAFEPKFLSVRDMMKEGMGGGKGEFYKGIERWAGEHLNDAAYRKAMEDGFRSREGQSVGVSSFHLDAQRLNQLHQEGVTYQFIPTNGEEITPTYFSDGRTRMMADYEAVKVDGWDNARLKLFPHDTPVYVAEIGKKQGRSDSGAFRVGKKWFKVYPDLASVPAGSRDSAVGVIRHHNMIRAAPGFGKLTGIKTKAVGAVHVFDYIMDMGARGFAREFKNIEKIFDGREKREEAEFMAGGIGTKLLFLHDRIPIGFGPEAFPTIKP